MATVRDFINYARLPPGEDDLTALLCYNAAVQSAADSGIPDICNTQNDAKYDLYIYALALYWYENRGFMPVGTQNAETRNMMRKMWWELKYRRSGGDGKMGKPGHDEY